MSKNNFIIFIYFYVSWRQANLQEFNYDIFYGIILKAIKYVDMGYNS